MLSSETVTFTFAGVNINLSPGYTQHGLWRVSALSHQHKVSVCLHIDVDLHSRPHMFSAPECRQRQVGLPGRDFYGRLCPHLDEVCAPEGCQRQVGLPGKELFRRLCPYLDEAYAPECCQRRACLQGRELYGRLCPHLDEVGAPESR